MVNKWIKFDSWPGLSASMTLFNKISLYVGQAESWGIGVKISFYDRAITFEILNLYAGVEIWHKE
jgi:hypothetical protein